MIHVANKKRKIIIYLINFFGLFFYPFYKLFWGKRKKEEIKQKIKENRIKNIYINLIDRLGDTVMATPMIDAIRNRFPNSQIVILTSKIGHEVLKNNPLIDEIIIINNNWISQSLVNMPRFLKGFNKSYFKKIKELRNRRIDLLIEVKGDFRNIIFFDIWLKAKYLAGYSLSGFGWMLDWEMQYPKDAHETEVRLNIAKKLGAYTKNLKPNFFLSDRDKDAIRIFLNKNSVNDNDFKAVLHITGTWAPRLWPVESFAEIAKKLQKKFNAKIFLIIAPGEEKFFEEFSKFFCQAISTIELTIPEKAALIKESDLFLGNDSGPAHIARSVKTPLVAIYGPDDPKRIGPQEGGIAVWKKFPCMPCGQVKCSQFPNCVQSINVDEVWDEIIKLLKNQ